MCKDALKLPVCKLARKTSSALQEAAHPTRPFTGLPRRGRKRLRSTWISRRRSNLVSRSMNRQTPAAAARVVAPTSAARDLGRDALTRHSRSVHAHLPGHSVCSLATAAEVCRLRPSTPRTGASDSDQNVSRRLRFADMLRNASDLYEQLGLCCGGSADQRQMVWPQPDAPVDKGDARVQWLGGNSVEEVGGCLVRSEEFGQRCSVVHSPRHEESEKDELKRIKTAQIGKGSGSTESLFRFRL